MALRVAILFLVLATPPAVYAATHVVGGNSGWAQGVDYASWAQGETFNVGDTLVFSYTSTHGVDVVSQSDYTNCNTGNAIQSFSGGSSSVPLQRAGPMYFICPTAGHCQGGMKLAVNVQGAASPGGSPSSTPPTPTNSTPNAPSGATGSLASVGHLMLGFSLVLAALFLRV